MTDYRRPQPVKTQLQILSHPSGRPHGPHIVLSVSAFLKMSFMMNAGPTEVAGFAVTRVGDPLYIKEFHTVKQKAWADFVEMDGIDIARHGVEMKLGKRVVADDGSVSWVGGRDIEPENCMKIWTHFHPGSSPCPSSHDEKTMEKSFAEYDWNAMLIMSRSHEFYARVVYRKGPYHEQEVDVYLDMSTWAPEVDAHAALIGQDVASWAEEYARNVVRDDTHAAKGRGPSGPGRGKGHAQITYPGVPLQAVRDPYAGWDGPPLVQATQMVITPEDHTAEDETAREAAQKAMSEIIDALEDAELPPAPAA